MQRDAVFCRGKLAGQFPYQLHLPAVISQGNGVVFRRNKVKPYVARVFFYEVEGQQGLGQDLRARKNTDHLGQVTHGHSATGVGVLLPAGQGAAPLLFNTVQLEDRCRHQVFDVRMGGSTPPAVYRR